MRLIIKAKPNSKSNQVILDANGNFHIKLMAIAVNGKANEALIAYLAAVLKLPKSGITLVSGFTSPVKRLEIAAEEEQVKASLTAAARKNRS
jgi:uncharacterized protein